MTQGVSVSKTLNVHASNTLSLTQLAKVQGVLIPVIGYTGGQTRYAFVRDITLGRDLYALNEDTVYQYTASVTKLMTALLLWEYKGSVIDSESVTFTTADVTLPGGISSGGFQAGDVTTWRGVLQGILIQSAGDACQCAARIIGTLIHDTAGSGTTGMTRFVERMNARALELGMNNTNYYDCYGYSGPGYNSSTARDNNIVGRTALSIGTIGAIANTASYSLAVTGTNPRNISLTNVNYFVNGPTKNPSGIKDAGSKGGKVGEWNGSGTHLNLTQLWQAPNGNVIAITTFNSESYYAMTLDQQGIIYQLLADWPYLDVAATSDPDFGSNKLLLGFDNNLTDESSAGHTATANAGSYADPFIHTTKAYDLNKGSYVTVVDDPDFEFLTDATIEVWYSGRKTGWGDELVFFGKADHLVVRREWIVTYYPGDRNFRIWSSSDGTNWTSAVVLNLTAEEESVFFNGAPRHFALTKTGSTWAFYINGERCTTTLSMTPPDTTAPVSLGYQSLDTTAPGKYDEFRITKGVARYSANKVTLYAHAFSRTVSPSQNASNTLVLTQSVQVQKTLNLSAINVLNMVQFAAKVTDVAAQSTLALTQGVTFERFKNVVAGNTLVLTQGTSRELSYSRSVFQGLALTQAARRTMAYARNITNILNLAQSVAVTVSKRTSNTLVLTQAATYDLVKVAKNKIELTQTVDRDMVYSRKLFSNLIPFQTLSLNGTYRRSVVSELHLTQTVVAHVVRAASNHLVLTQVAEGVVCKPAFNVLEIADLARYNATFKRECVDTLFLVQDVFIQKSKAVHAESVLGLNQFARGSRVISVSASNVLSLSHNVVRERFVKNVAQTLALTQAAVGHKVASRSTGNVLSLAQGVSVSKTIVRSVQHTLVFKTSTDKRTGISSLPVVSVPQAQVTVIRKKCVMILEGGNRAITLPCPEFNDTEGSVIQLNIKRAMDGTRRSYKRDNPTNTLSYDLVMDRLKALELRQFLLACNSIPLKLTNFKGEIWIVLLTNSPFSFTEDAFRNSPWGNRTRITLEFEGVRLH